MTFEHSNTVYIYPLMPSPARLLPLTGSAHRVVHGELGFNWWKKIWVSACQFATMNCSMWRSLRPSAGQAQQWVSDRISNETRSQAVARIADRTAKNCKGHAT